MQQWVGSLAVLLFNAFTYQGFSCRLLRPDDAFVFTFISENWARRSPWRMSIIIITTTTTTTIITIIIIIVSALNGVQAMTLQSNKPMCT